MIIIDIDKIKESLLGYSPDNADDFHTESAKKANKIFDLELKAAKGRNVILMCGGSASGKTEFIFAYLKDSEADGIVFDATLSTIEGAKIKIDKIKKSQNTATIHLILPDSLVRCFDTFNKRYRKIPENRFYETHSGAREVALWIANNYHEIEVQIYYNYPKTIEIHDSETNSKKIAEYLEFVRIDFEDRKEMIDFLKKEQYTQDEIQDLILNNS